MRFTVAARTDRPDRGPDRGRWPPRCEGVLRGPSDGGSPFDTDVIGAAVADVSAVADVVDVAGVVDGAGLFPGHRPAGDLAAFFARAGWSSRSSSREGYEVPLVLRIPLVLRVPPASWVPRDHVGRACRSDHVRACVSASAICSPVRAKSGEGFQGLTSAPPTVAR